MLGVSSRNCRQVADDDEMDEQCAGGPDPGGERRGPQAREQSDGDDEEQDHRTSPTAGSVRTGVAARSRRPGACRWSRSAGRAPRERAGWQAAAWSTRRRRARIARAVRWWWLALRSGWTIICVKSRPNSLRRGLSTASDVGIGKRTCHTFRRPGGGYLARWRLLRAAIRLCPQRDRERAKRHEAL